MRTTLLSLGVLVIGSACGGPASTGTPPFVPVKIGEPTGTLFAEGEIQNALTRDGCAYPVTIAGVTYAPSPASVGKVKAFAKEGSAPAALAYRLTGFTAQVTCGFNTRSTHAEIDVLALSAPCGPNAQFATTCLECGPAGGCTREQTACTPTCSASVPCASGVCTQGVCSAAAGCI